MTDALIKELCSGRALMEARQKYREHDAAAIAKSYRGVKSKGGLRHVAEIPQREYLQMIQKYGADCWSDVGFVRDFQRLEPTMASNKL